MAIGMLSDGWYAVLTGAALLFLASLLAPTPLSVDPAAPVVAVAFLLLGAWQGRQGVPAEVHPRRSTDRTG
ncbi:hypothetical protein HN031_12930 [Nocardioides sp. zg-1308]|uniref:hypothetical protein n=1 Tax=Nocardioides sp. zg-1308 TaxID=2736253 RepID=UPI001552F088|nr:hypothetical protein [Nocardioides sp. zg-1308]NPD05590.1 hypothetical protein [Nocardioides sp. zg-1308]